MCLVLILALLHSGLVMGHWSYQHEEQWPNLCNTGRQQSPIALSTDIATAATFPSLVFDKYDENYPVQLKNNGHSAEIRLHVEVQPIINGGGLPNIYLLDHLHFHWQSEHTVNDLRFPLEMHLVHYSSNYPNITEALKHRGGVAVFAVLFYRSLENDKHFEPLIEVIEKLHDKVNLVHQMNLNVEDFLPRDRAGFYRYNGSLTTPSCTEGLIWTVFTNAVPISQSQVDAFANLETDEHKLLKTNYRSLQDLNGRRVQLQESGFRSSAESVSTFSSLIFIFLASTLSFL